MTENAAGTSVFSVQVQPSGRTFETLPGEALLAAGIRQGIGLPYGCKDGACGSCKCKMISGTVVHREHQSKALTPEEEAQGFVLTCCAVAQSDLVLESKQVTELGALPIKKMPTRVSTLQRQSDDVMVMQLQLPANDNFAYRAGQYVEIILRDGSRRSYSMANAPHESDAVQLHIRNLPQGYFSDAMLKNIQVGDFLKLELPHGDFWLREDSERPMLMVAGGTGFAPIKSILDHIVRQKLQRTVHLYWGARTQDGIYAADVLVRWAQQSPGWVIHPLLSNATDVSAWTGRVGFVHEAVRADFKDLSDWDVYACGGMPMVTVLREVCSKLGLSDENFYSDAFVG